MLEKILSVSGKSGLFELISQGKNTLIAENLVDKKRIPIHARDKVVSLRDISMFTTEEDIPLEEVLEKVKEKYQGQSVDTSSFKDNDALRNVFGEILPNFDREHVYPTDIKKLFNWYNILINAGYTTFIDKVENETTEGKE